MTEEKTTPRVLKLDWKEQLGLFLFGWIMGIGVGIQLAWFIYHK